MRERMRDAGQYALNPSGSWSKTLLEKNILVILNFVILYESYQRCLALYFANIDGNSESFAPVVGVSNMLEEVKPVAEGGPEGSVPLPQQEIELKLCPTKLKFALAHFNHIYQSYK